MRIRIGTRYEDWTPEKLEAARAQSNAAAERYEPDPDDGWLSCWARDQTWLLYRLIEEILREPEGESQHPYHCGQRMANPRSRYGSFYACDKCGLKFSATVYYRFLDGTGRRNLRAEGVDVRTERWRKAIDMPASTVSYTVVRQSAEPLRVTAGQLLGCR